MQNSTNPTLTPIQSFIQKRTKEQKIKDSIAENETGGLVIDKKKNTLATEEEKYLYRRSAGTKDPTNEALGKYQVTSDELKTYSKIYLGRNISSDEFSKDRNAQETYMDNKIKKLSKEKHTPEQVADIHRRGIKNSSPAGSDIYQDPKYVRKFQRNYYGPLSDIKF